VSSRTRIHLSISGQLWMSRRRGIMNVSKQADAAFMHELERTDPIRYTNLMRNMRHAAGAASLAQRPSWRQTQKAPGHGRRATGVSRPDRPDRYETCRGAIHSNRVADTRDDSCYHPSLRVGLAAEIKFKPFQALLRLRDHQPLSAESIRVVLLRPRLSQQRGRCGASLGQ
jgi:hypothetical protein